MHDVATFVLRPPARQTLAESVTDSLREAIFAGVFRPSQRLAEEQLAKRLEVSRAPVREALAALEQEGLVSRSSAGTVISRLAREDVIEICSLRHALEVLAMRLALSRPTDELCRALADNIQRTREAADASQLARLDLEFHEIVVEAARHGRLQSNWKNLRSQIRLLMTQRNLSDTHSREATVVAHQELLALIGARDVERTVAMLERQLQSQYEWILGSFDGSGADSDSATDLA